MLDNIADYSHAIVSLLIVSLIILVQGPLAAAGKSKKGVAPGGTPETDYSNNLYRMERAHQNGIEILPSAAIALFCCILMGVSSWWVNLLMSVFLLTRIAYVFVYARNIGSPVQGLRTMIYVAGWAMIVILSIWPIVAVFS